MIEELQTIGEVLTSRIETYQGGPSVLIEDYGTEVTKLLYVWNEYGAKGEANRYIGEWLKSSPQGVIPLLFSYLPTAWGMESGLSHKSDFEREQFNSVIRIVEPEIILDALRQSFGDDLEVTEYPQFSDIPIELRTAQQFSWLHRNQNDESDIPEE